MSQASPFGSLADQNFLKYLLEDALHILDKQVTNPESKDFKKITHLLKKCELFQSLFPSQACLNDFVEVAKYYVGHEVHEYGGVILREKEYADKFCLILKGSVEKFRQKPYGEIEKEVHEERKRKSIAIDSMNLPTFSMPSLNLQGNNHRGHRPSKFIGSLVQHRTISPIEPTEGNGGPENGLEIRLESLADEKPQVTGLKRLSINVPAIEQEACEENEEEVEAEKATEEENAQEEDDDVKVRLKKRSITNSVQNPPLVSNFSKMLERLNSRSFPRKSQEEGTIKGGAGDETPMIGTNITLTEEELIRHICKKDSKANKTYITEDVLRATKIRSYKAGEYFGENFWRPNFPKSNSMLAASSEKVHLLTLSREDYNNIMTELERRNNEKLKVFWSIFPLADKKTVREFSQQFSQRSYQIDEVIYCKDDPVQDLYLLLSGEVKLCKESGFYGESTSPVSRRLSLANIRTGEVPMVTIIKHQFFGEELLLEMEERQSTAIARSPNTIAYFLEASVYEKIKEGFAGFFEVLKKGAQDKFAWRQQKLSEANENSTNNTLSLSPLRVQRHKSSKGILSPRTSILITDNQGSQGRLSLFLSSQKLESNVSSPRSSIPSFDDKQINSDEELPQKQRCEIYKSQFARKVVSVVRPDDEEGRISQAAKEEDKPLKKPFVRKSINFGPQEILEEFNLRRELYGDKKRVSHFGSPKHETSRKSLLPTTLPPLFDSPKSSKSNKETEPRASFTGMQNSLPKHAIFKRFIKKKNGLEYLTARSCENSPKNGGGLDNINVKKKTVPNQLRFK